LAEDTNGSNRTEDPQESFVSFGHFREDNPIMKGRADQRLAFPSKCVSTERPVSDEPFHPGSNW
jgi:hypothetical protein